MQLKRPSREEHQQSQCLDVILGHQVKAIRKAAGLTWSQLEQRLETSLAHRLRAAEQDDFEEVILDPWEALQFYEAVRLHQDQWEEIYGAAWKDRSLLQWYTELAAVYPGAKEALIRTLRFLAERGLSQGNLLRKLRKQAGLTQPQLAKLTQLHQSTISEMENGRVRGWGDKEKQKKRNRYFKTVLRELGIDPNTVKLSTLLRLILQ
jgi:transcriptional regulator with XRE-family HTH domain